MTTTTPSPTRTAGHGSFTFGRGNGPVVPLDKRGRPRPGRDGRARPRAAIAPGRCGTAVLRRPGPPGAPHRLDDADQRLGGGPLAVDDGEGLAVVAADRRPRGRPRRRARRRGPPRARAPHRRRRRARPRRWRRRPRSRRSGRARSAEGSATGARGSASTRVEVAVLHPPHRRRHRERLRLAGQLAGAVLDEQVQLARPRRAAPTPARDPRARSGRSSTSTAPRWPRPGARLHPANVAGVAVDHRQVVAGEHGRA